MFAIHKGIIRYPGNLGGQIVGTSYNDPNRPDLSRDRKCGVSCFEGPPLFARFKGKPKERPKGKPPLRVGPLKKNIPNTLFPKWVPGNPIEHFSQVDVADPCRWNSKIFKNRAVAGVQFYVAVPFLQGCPCGVILRGLRVPPIVGFP